MILPLTNNPEEDFRVPLFDIIYNFRQLWNSNYSFWTLDIRDNDGNVLVYGVKLVTRHPILEQYPQIPFELESSSDTDPGRYDASTFNLEVTSKDV